MEANPSNVMKAGEERVVQNQKESCNEQQGASKNEAVQQPAAGSCGLGTFHLWTTPSSTTTPSPVATISPDQLTIFYGGKVCVFDSIPAEKVCEIMLVAMAAAKPNEVKSAGNYLSSPVLARSPSLQSTASPLASPNPLMYPIQNNPLCKLPGELPIARRHSLQRFFEKRRDRLVNKAAPYPTKMAEVKETNLNTTASAEAGCFEKPHEENQPKAHTS